MIFFLTLTVRGPFHRKDFKWKKRKNESTGLVFKKMEALHVELTKRVEAATSSYSVAGDFSEYAHSVSTTENHQNIPSMCLVHEFSSTNIF